MLCEPNEEIAITANLDCLLRAFRFHDRDRLLWVDAICINQSDSAEKSHQVTNMLRKVYLLAEKSLVWLGPADERTANGISALRDIGGHPEYNSFLARIFRAENRVEREIREALGCDEKTSLDLKSILTRPWMDRRWVRQEIVLPREVEFHCGQYSLPSQVMVHATEILSPTGVWSQLPAFKWLFGSSITSVFASLHQRYKPALVQPLLSLLEIHQGTLCRDPRDLVYSLLSLCGDSFADFKIDYSLDVETSFTRVAHHLLLDQKDIGILHRSRKSKFRRSYVPDWREDTRIIRLGGYSPRLNFAAGFKDGNNVLPRVVATQDQLPSISGARVSRICNVFPRKGQLCPERPFTTISSWSRECERMFLGQKYPSTLEEPASAFIRTMIADSRSALNYRYHMKKLTLDDIHATFSAENIKLASDSGWAQEYDSVTMFLMGSKWEKKMITQYLKLAIGLIESANRCFVILDNSMIGLAPEDSREGDLVCVFTGGETPFVLRPEEPDADAQVPRGNDDGVQADILPTRALNQRYKVVGECYIHGAMDGEFVGSPEEEVWFNLT